MSQGSMWRKWDLHVHTPASFHNEFKFVSKEEQEKYRGDIWEKYIEELEKIPDVSVVGITDYFSVEGYKKVLEYKKNGRLANFDLILANIEFRLDKFVGVNRRLNYHVVFSDEVGVDKIEGEFLEELQITAPNAEPRKLTKGNIEEIGRILKDQHKGFKGKSDYVVGCENVTVSLDKIEEILMNKQSIFAGRHLLVLEEEGWDSINWDGQDHLTRKEILVRSDAIFSSNENTRDWALGKKHSTVEGFAKEFGSLKPCIHGSDAHVFEKICRPDQDRFCWIKADPCFEGLKQIIYEPEERVRIQHKNPENRKNIYTLTCVRIKNSRINEELSIQEQDVQLNPSLVAITGGKGTGKTALLDLVANCFEDRCKRAGEDSNSFVQRIELEKGDLEVGIDFTGTGVEGFSKQLDEETFFDNSRITYLPQGKIEEYSGNRQKLDRKIEEIIFSNKEIIEKGYKEEFERIKGETNQLGKEISEINRNIYIIEEETKPEITAGIESKKSAKDGELKNKEDELCKFTQSMEEDVKERIATLKGEETNLRVEHSKLESLRVNLEAFQSTIIEFTETSKATIDDLNSDLSDLVDNVRIPYFDFQPQMKSVDEALELVAKKMKDISGEIDKRKHILSQLSGVEKTQAALLKEIENIKVDIDSLGKQLKKVSEKKERKNSLESERMEKYQALLNKYMEWKGHYEEVISSFSAGKSEILAGIDFQSSIHFDKEHFIEIGSDLLDQRKIAQDAIRKIADELEAMVIEDSRTNLSERISQLVNKTFEQRNNLKKTRNNNDCYEWIFGDYFSLTTNVFFKGIPIDKLSMGQKGTVLLKLFLAEGDYPLVIDQPEESLDNKFIYAELVGAFRDAKKKRQVIIATNNANLAVNTDAEQLIVAEFENNVISYKSGTLENLVMREDIMPILEGGKEAFMKREKKYGIYGYGR